jgi:hypothetical protein
MRFDPFAAIYVTPEPYKGEYMGKEEYSASIIMRERGRIIVKGDKAWGVAYPGGGHGCSDSKGWVHPCKATVYGKHLHKPEDATYKGSMDVKKLREGSVVDVIITTSVETEQCQSQTT